MNHLFKKILRPFKYKFLMNIKYHRDFFIFKKINDNRLELNYRDKYPCLYDSLKTTPFDTHYVYHTSWAARILAEKKPLEHVDISSCLRFVSICSAFINFRFFDYRPPNINLSNLQSERADITSLPFEDNSVKSLSCMHVLEHIGLGRYGDPLDPLGDLKGAKELGRVLSRGGSLLLVVPISGRPRIEFNAHRIYSFEMIQNMFSNLKLIEFSLIPDNTIDSNGIIYNANEDEANAQDYGCGCFHFTKI